MSVLKQMEVVLIPVETQLVATIVLVILVTHRTLIDTTALV